MSCGYVFNSTWLAASTTTIQDTGIEENPDDKLFNFNETAMLLDLGGRYVGPNLKYTLIG